MTCSIEGCPERAYARSWCRRHYYRWKRQGDPTIVKLRILRSDQDPEKWFWETVIRGAPDACWLWAGTTNSNGYGITSRRFLGSHLAHRVALHLSGVTFADADKVLHACDNPPCCNPAHLRIGTQADNVKDMHDRGRARSAGGRPIIANQCPRGHEYTPDNTYYYPTRSGRECRICMREKQHLLNLRRKANGQK